MKRPGDRYGFLSRRTRRRNVENPESASDLVRAALGLRPRGWRALAWWQEVCLTALEYADGHEEERDPEEWCEDDLDPIGNALSSVQNGPWNVEDSALERYEITKEVYGALNGVDVHHIHQAVLDLFTLAPEEARHAEGTAGRTVPTPEDMDPAMLAYGGAQLAVAKDERRKRLRVA